MRVNTNMPALTSYNALNSTNGALQKSIERLSSGLRVNRAADDAAGLAMSEKMRAQIGGLDQAGRNAQDGASMIATAEGALNEVHSILQRMRELSVQAANDSHTAEDRAYIQLEVEQLVEEINRISTTTQFNKKKLLDGSSSILWSTDNLDTRVLAGGRREGNYKVAVRAEDTGQAEVQKSNIFLIKHKDVMIGAIGDKNLGEVTSIRDYPPGDFKLSVEKATYGDAWIQQSYGFDIPTAAIVVDYSSMSPPNQPRQNVNANVLFEVADVDRNTGVVRFSCQSTTLGYDGEIQRFTADDLTVSADGISGTAGTAYDKLGFDLSLDAIKINDLSDFDVGDKMVMRFAWSMNPSVDPDGDMRISLEGSLNQDWERAWPEVGPNGAHTLFYDETNWYNLAPSEVRGKTVELTQWYLNPANGESFEGVISVTFASDLDSSDYLSDSFMGSMAFTSTFVGQVADERVSLRDIEQFWDVNGRFLLDTPQRFTIAQGDGKASVTLYDVDTLGDVARKLNDAIGVTLGQDAYLSSRRHFAEMAVGTPSTHESVNGTMLLRSVVLGRTGSFAFSAGEDILNAFGFNIIQHAADARYNAAIVDAHSGELVSRVSYSGDRLIDAGFDLALDPMIGISAVWNEKNLRYDLIAGNTFERTVHIADNSTYLQIGANAGENMIVMMAEISAASLGLNGITVVDREHAAAAVTVIDSAIGIVSSQRATLGAYQNRLETTITNLATARENTMSSESRIRDADIAKETMNFTKLNILSQAGFSMLTQANQFPQNVLSLLR
jgi:flagellin